ncbi:tetratricopeptide repeat-containing protein [Sphingomonas canadensis]|uniref:Tetratricopeptide repeat-containing protein n=1 Tax=Sphingomonas canadensis TaxID=1219257 RepID=A0ABW3H4N3_9SPHN|nr:tetratricopeptide repeat-containing protein [Sphingomonas canadensis]MCW3836156.1 hypothetical protein [Sphingomonas canadensis]
MSFSLAEVHALARAGAKEAARAAFSAAGLDGVADDPAVLTLKGRLLKDAADGASGAARAALLGRAADAYAAAARLSPAATYPLINAATLALLSGAGRRAEQLARETLALLDGGAHEPDTPYWLGATRSEALLLTGRETEARAALRDAIAGSPEAWEDHAVTLRQFRRILDEQGRPAQWLEGFRPPPAVHFAGPIGVSPDDRALIAALDSAAATIGGGTACGALAAGFDILAAEALLRAGARLQIVLPGPVDAFAAASVLPAGAAWLPRFEALLAAALSVETLDLPGPISAAAAVLAEEMALGEAVRRARERGSGAVALRAAGAASATPMGERPGLRCVTVACGANPAGGGERLAPPARPMALLGCHHGAAERLAAVAGEAPVRITPAGAYVALADLAGAAAAALALFDADSGAHPVLDYAVADAAGLADTAALDVLQAIPAQPYPVATRAASLGLEARGAPFVTAPAGAGAALAGSVDFLSLWRAAGATPPDRRADGAN